MKSWIGWLVTALVLAVVVALPLFFAIDAAFYKETKLGLSDVRSLQAVIDVYTGADYYGYLGITLLISALVTALSMAFGVTAALIVGRSDLPFKKTADVLILLPLFLSPFTGLMAWILLGSEKTGLLNVLFRDVAAQFGVEVAPLINIWSFAGVVWVLFLFFAPLAYLFTLGSLTSMDATLEESARTAGAPLSTVIFKITLPMCAPALFAAGPPDLHSCCRGLHDTRHHWLDGRLYYPALANIPGLDAEFQYIAPAQRPAARCSSSSR